MFNTCMHEACIGCSDCKNEFKEFIERLILSKEQQQSEEEGEECE